ncbi:hypothetical protein AB0M20_12320 [Actinoplanes sp. NPDC051633]|uniref:hypothetical protein n=1 Tax=Actinoplanes sp. NPDC051633 TaxID=3155670 RepID=UPI0034152ED5
MLSERLTALARAGGAAIVDAAVAGGWTAARTRIAEVFAAGDQHRIDIVERRLEETRTRLDEVPTPELEALRLRLTLSWSTRLEDLLDEHPDAADRLERLLSSGA